MPTGTSPPVPASAAPAILVRGLHKRFGETVAVKSLDLQVQRGECGDADDRSGKIELEEAAEQGHTRPDVALWQRDGLNLLELFEKSVRHGGSVWARSQTVATRECSGGTRDRRN